MAKHDWQLQEAKANLSRVVAAARDAGPQTITVHGRATAVVLSADAYRELIRPRETLSAFLGHSPLAHARIRIRRATDPGRRTRL